MAESTSIEWCDATFNPWWGCQKVSPACDHCYAERDSKRFAPGRVLWGVGSERRTFGEGHWNEPLKWAARGFASCSRCAWRGEQRAAAVRDAPGESMPFCPSCDASVHKARRRVFCASMGDWLDLDAPLDQFVRLLDTIRRTPELDWLLLSKRIGNWRKRLSEAANVAIPRDDRLHEWINDWLHGVAPANVWLGATVIDQTEADRDVPKLLAVPARVRFLSIEPMLGPINLADMEEDRGDSYLDPLTAWTAEEMTAMWGEPMPAHPRIDWVICGGESGPHARPMHPDWVRSLRDQCKTAGVPFLFKQWGEWAEHDGHRPTRVFSMDTDVGETLAGRCDGFISVAGEFVRDMDDATTDEPYRGMVRVGKKAAGRLLDGRTHDGFPA